MPRKLARRSKDVVFVGGPTDHGDGVNVIRAREERLEFGTLEPLREGKPIHGEVVRLVPRPELPRVFDVETEVDAPATPALTKSAQAGPAQVASDTYRKNWDAIWSRPAKRQKPN